MGFSQYGLTCKYGIILNINVQLDAELGFLIISGVATADYSVFFFYFFSLSWFYIKDERQSLFAGSFLN